MIAHGGWESCPWCGITDGPAVCRGCVERLRAEPLAGKYELLRPLGQGACGVVFEARHAALGRRFAVKLLHAQLRHSVKAVQRFEREARAAAQLESPHVCAALDFGVTADGAPFIVLERLTGRSLDARLEAGALGVTEAIEIAVQICRGLDAAHAHGVVHRDLKPSNVFLCDGPGGAPHVKLLDFGIAKLLGPGAGDVATAPGSLLGTPQYMAPEQARGETSRVDARADVYAVGVMLYEMLAGCRPFDGENPNAVLFRVMEGAPPPLPPAAGVPPALVALVARAMARDPADRPPGAAALAAQLVAAATPGDRGDPPAAPASIPAASPSSPSTAAATRSEARGAAAPPGRDAPPAGRRGRRVGVAGGLLGGAAALALALAVAVAAGRPGRTSTSTSTSTWTPASAPSGRRVASARAASTGGAPEPASSPRAPSAAPATGARAAAALDAPGAPAAGPGRPGGRSPAPPAAPPSSGRARFTPRSPAGPAAPAEARAPAPGGRPADRPPPGAAGDRAPGAVGDRAPGAVGDRAPAAAGDRAPAAAGDRAPASAGDRAPAAAGDRAPASAVDRDNPYL